MMTTVTEACQLEEVLDSVHDRWFDADEVTLDPMEHSVRILLYEDRRDISTSPGNHILLDIKHVEKLVVEDTERVGFYDLNRIDYDENQRRIRISGGVPIFIDMIVGALEIQVSKDEGKCKGG